MTYENGGQLDRALKKAVRDRGGDLGDGYRQALRDRFLCRVFSDPDGRFILKGGSGLLARIPDGRATRDIDFATASRESSEDALAALVELAGRDMGDFLSFRLDKWSESLDDNGARACSSCASRPSWAMKRKTPSSLTCRWTATSRSPQTESSPPIGSASRDSSRAITSSIRFPTSWQTSCAP